jgi:hypothetical protein
MWSFMTGIAAESWVDLALFALSLLIALGLAAATSAVLARLARQAHRLEALETLERQHARGALSDREYDRRLSEVLGTGGV